MISEALKTGKKFLVTGCAGFIGFHLAERLLKDGWTVVGVDSLSDYYDVKLKQARLKILQNYSAFSFFQKDLALAETTEAIFPQGPFDAVFHLAAQPGVQYSLKNPQSYVSANLVGFANLLEGCRKHSVGHLVFASSSSVYGANEKVPFSTKDNVDHPISLYAATKKSNELMAHVYAHLFRIPCTGLRFFTVYGPWGRPDMALFRFTRAICNGDTLEIYGEGQARRDFTYVDDIVEAVVRVARIIPRPDSTNTQAPYQIYNVGNRHPVSVSELVSFLEKELGKTAQKQLRPLPPGDVPVTWADTGDLEAVVGVLPHTPLSEGVKKFVHWYREFYS